MKKWIKLIIYRIPLIVLFGEYKPKKKQRKQYFPQEDKQVVEAWEVL
jgi:hypothetical protein